MGRGQAQTLYVPCPAASRRGPAAAMLGFHGPGENAVAAAYAAGLATADG